MCVCVCVCVCVFAYALSSFNGQIKSIEKIAFPGKGLLTLSDAAFLKARQQGLATWLEQLTAAAATRPPLQSVS